MYLAYQEQMSKGPMEIASLDVQVRSSPKKECMNRPDLLFEARVGSVWEREAGHDDTPVGGVKLQP